MPVKYYLSGNFEYFFYYYFLVFKFQVFKHEIVQFIKRDTNKNRALNETYSTHFYYVEVYLSRFPIRSRELI